MTSKDDNVQLAKLAEQAERYDDMVTAMKRVVEYDSELTNEERNLLSVAYMNVIGAHRFQWRFMSSVEQKVGGSEPKQKMAKEYREKIERELKDRYYELLILLDKYLIPKSTTAESKVFYLKMKGNYYQYFTELVTGNERQKMVEESRRAYTDCFDVAKNLMPVAHPSRLCIVLSLSVFHYEILNERNVACRLAKQTLDDALVELDTLDNQSRRDSSCILQLLRDNLNLWTSDGSDFDDADQLEEHP